ncbi:sodium:solute symporter [Bacteroides sp. 519]|uniref:sodium:solute symporter n=1 Tax=Bacteroides sp. 519 TaxID=2302937 RepID=UPI0013D10981|nr:sodium:solute symporter [Bacteroides sp. 519]NDV60184.1 sodium:solute symporter [Bacteroides sp. 519]
MIILVTIICYFSILLLIARITGRKGGSNAAFFKANNKSPWYLVAFGMIGASISGVTFVSVPGMVRSMDMTYMQTVTGFFFGYIFVAHVLLPLYYKLNLTSIYTYLGKRLGTRSYRTGSLFFLLSRMLGTAAKLYLVCLILYNYVFIDFNIPFWVIATGAVALVWIYTQKNGIKTIVWTDTLQTMCIVLALLFIIISISSRLNLNFGEMVQAIRDNEHSRIFVFDSWISRQNFFKQFISGIFIVIVMTGLDQDMMQKNLTCRNLKDAQKNMYWYGFAFIPLNFLFLCMGILLLILGEQPDINLPPVNDDILPMLASEGHLGQAVLVLFTIGIIAAAFSNSDSALTSMTTSFCVDILETEKYPEEIARRKRQKVHLYMSVILIVFICFFRAVNNNSIIDAIYIIASYTYGPLLGMFAFGLFTKRQTKDKWVPYIAIASPVICYLADWVVRTNTSYKFGYEMLMINGLLTFAGLYILSYKQQNSLNHGN